MEAVYSCLVVALLAMVAVEIRAQGVPPSPSTPVPGGTPSCSPIWTNYTNTNVAGGIFFNTTTFSACQAACISNPSCTGIDWDEGPSGMAGQKCWLCVTANGAWNNGTAISVTHSQLDRNINCQGSSCSTWTPFANTNANGGTYRSGAATLSECQALCLADQNCNGVDWDLGPSGQKCWTVTGNGAWNNGTSSGVTHYQLNRITNCQSANCWTPYQSTNVAGGTADQSPTLAACQAACVGNLNCKGIDWDSTPSPASACWIITGSGAWNNGTSSGVTHYQLNRNCGGSGSPTPSAVSPTPSAGQQCTDTWTESANTNVLNGKGTADNTPDACKATCLADSTCTGADYNPSNSQSNRCFLSGPWSGTRNNGTASGITHYDRTRTCTGSAGCTYSWVASANTNYLNGRGTADNTVEACQASCIANTTCTGIDFNPANPAYQRCYWSGSWSGTKNVGTATGITHYELTRTCSDCSSGASWIVSSNTNVLRGQGTSDNTEDACKQSCVNNAACTGVDFNAASPSGQRCYQSGSWSGTRNNGTATGITHYDIVRSTCLQGSALPPTAGLPATDITSSSPCSVTFIRSDNTNVLGGTATSYNTEAACKAACASNDQCRGCDWNTVNLQCYLILSAGGIRNNGTITGITHWDAVRSCSGVGQTVSPLCSYNWTLDANMLIYGGQLVSTANTELECKTACILQRTCIGCDLDKNAANGSRCFLTITDGAKNPASNIDHYTLARGGGASC